MPAMAQEDFNPNNPPEPQVIPVCYLTVSAVPAEGATVSGGGKYKVTGGRTYISTSARNNDDYRYVFQYWTLDGVRLNQPQWFYYTPTEGTHQLVAHYEQQEVEFDPSNPAEPSTSVIVKKYRLYLTSNIEGACSFSINSGDKHPEGQRQAVRAYYNSENYRFEGWKMNGEIVCTTVNYTNFIMPGAETTLEAVFSELPYDPENPLEPSGNQDDVQTTDPNRKQVKLYIGGAENSEVDYTTVIFNESKSLDYEIGVDMAKTISTTADYQIYSMDAKATSYAINERPVSNGNVPLAVMVNKPGTVIITATRLDCSCTLVDKTLGVTHDLSTGPYTFTSEAGTFTNRFVLRTPTLGGFIPGDANNSGEVNVSDITAVVSHIYGKTPANFNFEAADVNGSGEINVSDITGIVTIIYGGSVK